MVKYIYNLINDLYSFYLKHKIWLYFFFFLVYIFNIKRWWNYNWLFLTELVLRVSEFVNKREWTRHKKNNTNDDDDVYAVVESPFHHWFKFLMRNTVKKTYQLLVLSLDDFFTLYFFSLFCIFINWKLDFHKVIETIVFYFV